MPGPWASFGIQEKSPAALMLAPSGAPGSSVNVRILTGKSLSVAVALKERSVPSLTVWGERAPSEGGVFTSCTVTAKVRVALKGGEPLSVTRTVML